MTSRLSATSPGVTSASIPQLRVDSESGSTVSISSLTRPCSFRVEKFTFLTSAI